MNTGAQTGVGGEIGLSGERSPYHEGGSESLGPSLNLSVIAVNGGGKAPPKRQVLQAFVDYCACVGIAW